jgi:integrase/recombinase XerD
LTKALTGFVQYKQAEGLSPRTIEIYSDHLKKWAAHAGDPPVAKIRTTDIRAYLAWLANDYRPTRFGKLSREPLSPKTVHNVWISLSAFFTWASDEFGCDNPMKQVSKPRYEPKPFQPYTREEVEALLKACEKSKDVITRNRRRFAMRPPLADRNAALVLVLLDSGLRSGEVCALNLRDYDEQTGKLEVKHGRAGGAKGRKGRVVYLGKAARRSLWRYLAKRDADRAQDPDAPLFLSHAHRRIDRDLVRQILKDLGERANVKDCHAHRFRHTFAITYLRSGGDVFTLQALLGHTTLEMVQHYARLAQIDVAQAHRRASPADNWHL